MVEHCDWMRLVGNHGRRHASVRRLLRRNYWCKFPFLFQRVLALPKYLFQVLGSNEPDEDIIEKTNMYSLVFVIAGLFTGTATFLQIYMFGIAGEKLTMRLRNLMFVSMLNQEIGWFDRKENAVGSLCAKLSNEAASVQGVRIESEI